MITVSIEPANVEALKALAYVPGAIRKVTTRAIKKSITAGKREAKSGAKRRYTLPSGIVGRAMTSSAGGLRGQIRVVGSRNKISQGKVKETAHGVYALIVRGQGGVINKAFKKKYQGGWWQRLGKPRFPIRELKTVSAPGMVSHPTVSTPTVNKMGEILNREILNGIAAVI